MKIARLNVQIGVFGLTSFILSAIWMVGVTLPASGADSSADSRPPVKMEKYVVSGKHLLCFGIAITPWENKNTQRVMAMCVKDVAPESMAGEKELAPGTRIYSINGVPVKDFEATFSDGSDLGKLFVDRKKGDQITVEIGNLGQQGTKYVTLIQSPGMSATFVQPHDK